MEQSLAVVRDNPIALKIAIAFGLLVIFGLVILGGVFMLGTFFFYDSYTSAYDYELSVSVDGATDELVILVPVPTMNEEASLDELHISTSDRFSDIDTEVVETQYGPMLRIEIGTVETGDRWHDLFITSRTSSDRTIETKDPRGQEPILAPLELIESQDDGYPDDRWPNRTSFDAISTAYIEHDGGEDVEIGVTVSYRGSNEWWTFGWSGNEYETVVWSDEIARDPTGTWIELRGWHTEGSGRYPTFPPAPS